MLLRSAAAAILLVHAAALLPASTVRSSARRLTPTAHFPSPAAGAALRPASTVIVSGGAGRDARLRAQASRKTFVSGALAALAATAATQRSGAAADTTDLARIASLSVQATSDGASVTIGELAKGKETVFAFFTHYGDFNSWEYAQRLKYVLPALKAKGTRLVCVGIGTPAQARKFSELLDFDGALLYSDPTAASHRALGFSRGFGADTALNGYAKLFPMLLGIGSPGTLQAVFRGYRGDSGAQRDWVSAALQTGSAKGRFPTGLDESAWDSIGSSGLRPFELATLRLQNMVDGIIGNFAELAPADDQLLVQQGGTVFLSAAGETRWKFADKGILTYTDVEALLAKVL